MREEQREAGHRVSRPGRRVLPAIAAALSLACAGCGLVSGGGHPASSAASTAASASPPVTSSPRAAAAGAAASPSASSSASCPDQVLATMTEAQRIGQLFLVGIAGAPAADVAAAVRTYHFGSLLFEGNSTAGVAADQRVTRAVQDLASTAGTAGVRFFVAANEEGGEVQELRGPGFSTIPSALSQGELSDARLQQQAAAWGDQLRQAGVNLDLAPVMDVVPSGTASENAPVGALDREFGYTPQVTGPHGVAFIRGMRQAGVATTAKHFPGLGRVAGNTDFTSAVVDRSTGPDDAYLTSFGSAISAGVPFVMVALATYTQIDPDHLAAFSPRVMQGLLRQQMHFQGVIISDDLGAAAAVADLSPAARGVDFVAAGGDMITSQSLTAAEAMDRAIVARAAQDQAFRDTVNAAVSRVLAAKQAYHLMTSC